MKNLLIIFIACVFFLHCSEAREHKKDNKIGKLEKIKDSCICLDRQYLFLDYITNGETFRDSSVKEYERYVFYRLLFSFSDGIGNIDYELIEASSDIKVKLLKKGWINSNVFNLVTKVGYYPKFISWESPTKAKIFFVNENKFYNLDLKTMTAKLLPDTTSKEIVYQVDTTIQ